MKNKRFRVACLLQSGKEILKQHGSDKLCFMVSNEKTIINENDVVDPTIVFN